MKIEHFVFALTVALGGLLVVALLTPEPPGGHGTLHSVHASMLSGGSGEDRHGPILGLAWAIGTVQILLFVALMLMGSRRGDGLPEGLVRLFTVGTLAYVGAWTAVILTYRSFMHDPDPGLWLALPTPTAWMLYLLWPIPVVFACVYIFGFRRFVLSEEHQAAFDALVARRRAAEKEGAESDEVGMNEAGSGGVER